MSKVSFADDAKSKYVSAPLKTVVDLSKTTMSLCVRAPDSAVQPAPTATVAGSSGLQNNQFFDITALVQDVAETRGHAENRSSFVVKIQDGSLDKDSGKVKLMPFRVYFDTVPTQNQTMLNSHLQLNQQAATNCEHLLKSTNQTTNRCDSSASVAQRTRTTSFPSAQQKTLLLRRHQAPKPTH